MTPRVVALIVSGALNLALLGLVYWLLDRIAAERARAAHWREEARYHQARRFPEEGPRAA